MLATFASIKLFRKLEIFHQELRYFPLYSIFDDIFRIPQKEFFLHFHTNIWR